MQLTRFTDYSLRVLIYLGLNPDSWVTIREISDAYGVSRNHLMKVVSFLTRQGYLVSQRGPGGGIRLKHPPEDINLASVVLAAEGDMDLIECFRADHGGVLGQESRLRSVMGHALQAFLDTLEQHRLSDLLEPRDELSRQLGIRAAG